MIRSVCILLLSFALIVWGRSELQSNLAGTSDAKLVKQEVLYLPNGEGLEVISFGYQNVLADILWFNTVNYFGKHFRQDKNYQWFSHMCDLVTTLNPEAHHVFHFCGTMLSWEANLPNQAIEILTKAIQMHPNKWEYHYLRGFSYMFFLKDNIKAKEDLVRAAQLPDADPLIKRLAAKQIALLDDPDTAIDFLTNLLKQAESESEIKVLQERLSEAFFERDLILLRRAVDLFEAKFNRRPETINELSEQGIVKSDFKDPFGGIYTYDANTGEIGSTSKKRGLKRKK